MGLSHFRDLLFLLTLSFGLSMHVVTCLDTITPSYILKESETLSSNDSLYQLGFFTPTNSTGTYLGIWYVTKPPFVWVANRDQPLKDSSDGVLKISEDGNLVVVNGQKDVIWSTNIVASNETTIAKLLSTGNLVLQENTTGRILWQSFQHPTDTLLQKMQLKTNSKLTSWRSPQDPSIGDFSFSIERLNIPEVFTWRGSQPYWRSGPWNGQIFLGIPDMDSNYLDGFYLGGGEEYNTTYYLSYNFVNQSLLRIFVLNPEGNFHGSYWDYANRKWITMWSAINSDCDVYGTCGAFGKCDPTSSPICSCLVGYEPRNVEEWNGKNWSSGCVRKQPLKCERPSKNGSEAGSNDKDDDGFVKLQNAKVPDFAQLSSFPADCRDWCLKNCSCIAYAYDAGIGCMLWSKNLTDIQMFSKGGTDLYIRVPYSELDEKRNKDPTVIIAVCVIIGAIIIVACAIILWKRTMRRDKSNLEIWKRRKDDQLSEVKLPELTLFEFKRLALATNNFGLSNKLGQGGFGPVYKGTLEDGKEIAVKRLSRASQQGLEEFMNEVVVISKLQHRNLVKLLGCCIEGDENILIYEYLPNRSLDAYIFAATSQILNWEKRFNLIEGIARGLLYLHRDSRLRIIHRDLKLSNILLDEELNPKISDFGLAKIFDTIEDEANTRRIVGTYGYMSPEYAIQGLFSEKSDVFSFGVLLLEIVCRKKITNFYEDGEYLTLLGFVWKLWNANNITSILDPEISSPNNNAEIMRCIHIGLLCVQEFARDRPTMTTVVSMLNSETTNLPLPKQPAFIQRQTVLDIESSLSNEGLCSINYASLTDIGGR